MFRQAVEAFLLARVWINLALLPRGALASGLPGLIRKEHKPRLGRHEVRLRGLLRVWRAALIVLTGDAGHVIDFPTLRLGTHGLGITSLGGAEIAYGSAADIPGLLRAWKDAVSAEAREQPFFDLWSALAHQSDVYTGSYAAVPHLANMTAGCDGAARVEVLHLAAVIEACRHRSSSPPVPDELMPAYRAGVGRLATLAGQIDATGLDEDSVRAIAGVVAIGAGQPHLGMAILDLEREAECPECGHVYQPLGWELYDAAAEDL